MVINFFCQNKTWRFCLKKIKKNFSWRKIQFSISNLLARIKHNSSRIHANRWTRFINPGRQNEEDETGDGHLHNWDHVFDFSQYFGDHCAFPHNHWIGLYSLRHHCYLCPSHVRPQLLFLFVFIFFWQNKNPDSSSCISQRWKRV